MVYNLSITQTKGFPMKYTLIIALFTLITAAWSVEVDLTDVELSEKSAEALADFNEKFEELNQEYLKDVNDLREKYIKKMEYDAKKQDDIKVVMKIEQTIKELQDKKAVNLFGEEIKAKEAKLTAKDIKTAEDLEKYLIGTKWKSITTTAAIDSGEFEFKSNGVLISPETQKNWRATDNKTVIWGVSKRVMTFDSKYETFTDSYNSLKAEKIK